MTDVSFLRRPGKPGPRTQQAESDPAYLEDPEVHQFLKDFMTQQNGLRQMASGLRNKDLQIDKLSGQAEWQRHELDRQSRMLAAAQKTCAEQRINFAVALTSALSARDHATAAVKAVYKQVKAANAVAYEQATAANGAAYEEAMRAIKSAFEPFIEAAHAAQKAIDAELRAAGLSDEPRAVNVDVDAIAIAAKYGANNRSADTEA